MRATSLRLKDWIWLARHHAVNESKSSQFDENDVNGPVAPRFEYSEVAVGCDLICIAAVIWCAVLTKIAIELCSAKWPVKREIRLVAWMSRIAKIFSTDWIEIVNNRRKNPERIPKTSFKLDNVIEIKQRSTNEASRISKNLKESQRILENLKNLEFQLP